MTGADVRSIAGLREWLAAAQTYRHACEESLASARLEIRRALDWLLEQEKLWERAIRVCEERVVQAKAELAARRFPDFSGRMPDTTVQERNLRRAEAELDHAHEQVRRCRKWSANLPRQIDELFTGTARGLESTLEVDLAKGLAQLARQLEALESYAGVRPDFAPAPSTTGRAAPANPTGSATAAPAGPGGGEAS